MVRSRRGLRQPGRAVFRPQMPTHLYVQGASKRDTRDETLLGRAHSRGLRNGEPNGPKPGTSGDAAALLRLTLRQHGKPVSEQDQPVRPSGQSSAESNTAAARHRASDTFRHVDLDRTPPDPRLLNRMPPAFWLRHGAVPWLRLGDAVVVAMADPSRAPLVQEALHPHYGVNRHAILTP